jgi:tetratricopeptide (TPR) repeat protein
MRNIEFQEPKSEEDLDSYRKKIHGHLRLKELAPALVICQHLILGETTKRSGYRERAEVWRSIKEKKLALADLRKVTSLGSEEPADYFNLGVILFELRELNQAVESFTKAIELGKRNDFNFYTQTSYLRRAIALLSLGFHEKALKDCEQVEDGYQCFIVGDGIVTKEDLISRASQRRAQ